MDAEPAPDEPAGGGRRVLGHRPDRLPRTIGVAVLLGGFGGLVTVAFIRALEGIQELLWTDLPDGLDVEPTSWTFIVPTVVVGAVLLGLARKVLGEYPVSLEQAIEDHKAKGEFDHRHIGQAIVISIVSLGFGAALGPEAALMAILGGLGSWIARVIDVDAAEGSDLSYVGIVSALGALFGTAGAAALALDPRTSDAEDARSGRLWRLVPGVAAAGAGLFVYRHLGSSEHYFDLGLPSFDLAAADLAWALVPTAAGIVAGLAFLAGGRLLDARAAGLRERPVLESVVGGLVLAGLASWVVTLQSDPGPSLVLFSGHQGVDTLIRDYGDDSVGFLVLVAAAKVVAAVALLATRWKGGRFFPLMFAGAAVGIACSQAVGDVGEVVGIAAGMTAAVGVLLRRPVLTVLFMVWFFPLAAWPLVVLAALLGCLVGTRLGDRISGEAPASEGPGTDVAPPAPA